MDILMRQQLIELLRGGFAPNVILLSDFPHDKTGIILPGLHFSAWILLGHMQARQHALLSFMKTPGADIDVWPDAHWPANYRPQNKEEWAAAIDVFGQELEEIISIINDPATPLFDVQQNGKTISWAAMTALHHNAYHIGQLKTIGRQLGVW